MARTVRTDWDYDPETRRTFINREKRDQKVGLVHSPRKDERGVKRSTRQAAIHAAKVEARTLRNEEA
jgi:hypothetical protein